MSKSIVNGHVAKFEDKYGEERIIHMTPNGLRVKRTDQTPILAMNPVVSEMIGERIRELRVAQGLTLKQLALRSGMNSGHPKNRMWEIEKGVRNEGMRLGTLYTIAMALGVEATDLLPSNERVARMADLCGVEMMRVAVRGE